MSDAITPKPPILAADARHSGVLAGFRWIPLLLCAATMFTEGYDAQFMGAVVPGIAKDWGIMPSAVTPALVAGLVGLMLGAFLIAPLADNFGRRRVVIYSVAAFGLLTIVSAWAETMTQMTILRFLTGLGIGGAMANTTALTAENSPPEKRATAVAIMFCTFSLGAAFGGFVAASLMPDHGWEPVFLICGGMAVALLPLLIVALPESLPPKANARVSIPVGRLFSDGRARITILLWIVFFANLMELYLITSWLPTTINAQGVDLRSAQIATALVQLGGIAGAFALAPLVDRYGPQFVLAGAFATAALSIITLGVAGTSVGLTLVAAFALGIGTVGAQNCNNGIAAKFYPTEIRATGVGWALAVGRIGSILGPAIGGILLATGFDIRSIFLVAIVPPLVAASAYLAMGRLRSLQGDAS
jgi:AAHS family 4-hydroxybenzoate transporter-like MFS transporter